MDIRTGDRVFVNLAPFIGSWRRHHSQFSVASSPSSSRKWRCRSGFPTGNSRFRWHRVGLRKNGDAAVGPCLLASPDEAAEGPPRSAPGSSRSAGSTGDGRTAADVRSCKCGGCQSGAILREGRKRRRCDTF